jgi:hypothetical protein
LWVHVCPWLVHAPKVLQLCTNQLFVWFVQVRVNNWPACHWNHFNSLCCMILVIVVEITSIGSYIMVYIPTFFFMLVCLFACKKYEMHGVQKGSYDSWRNIVQSHKCSTKSCFLDIYVSQQAKLSFTCKVHYKFFHVFW